MTEIMKIETITDAEIFVQNSGVHDWDWGEYASSDGFAVWIFANCSEIDRDEYQEELNRYLVSVDRCQGEIDLTSQFGNKL